MQIRFYGLWLNLFLIGSCATTDSNSKDKEVGEPKFDAVLYEEDDITFTHSLSMSGLLNRFYSIANARKQAALLARVTHSDGNVQQNLTDLVSLQRLAKDPLTKILAHTRKLADIRLSQDVTDQVDDKVVLELAISALQDKKYGFLELFLQKLLQTQNDEIKAAAYNIRGLFLLRLGKTPEAVSAFEKSIQASDDFVPSLLNLGFLSLKFGNFTKAQNLLSRVSDDWLASSGEAVALRNLDNATETEQICEQLLPVYSKHKAILFNCGLHYLQSNQDKMQAKDLISRALKLKGGPSNWDRAGFKLLNTL